MSKKEHVSATPATMWLKQHKVPFEDGIYEYVEHGGTAQAATLPEGVKPVESKTVNGKAYSKGSDGKWYEAGN